MPAGYQMTECGPLAEAWRVVRLGDSRSRRIDFERGMRWRCEGSLALKRFLGYEPHERTPDHSTLSRMRSRLPARTDLEVSRFMMRIRNEKGLMRGKVVGVDAT